MERHFLGERPIGGLASSGDKLVPAGRKSLLIFDLFCSSSLCEFTDAIALPVYCFSQNISVTSPKAPPLIRVCVSLYAKFGIKNFKQDPRKLPISYFPKQPTPLASPLSASRQLGSYFAAASRMVGFASHTDPR
jgi:hypothetical protein